MLEQAALMGAGTGDGGKRTVPLGHEPDQRAGGKPLHPPPGDLAGESDGNPLPAVRDDLPLGRQRVGGRRAEGALGDRSHHTSGDGTGSPKEGAAGQPASTFAAWRGVRTGEPAPQVGHEFLIGHAGASLPRPQGDGGPQYLDLVGAQPPRGEGLAGHDRLDHPVKVAAPASHGASSGNNAARRRARCWRTLALLTVTSISRAASLIGKEWRNRSSRIRRYGAGNAPRMRRARSGAPLPSADAGAGSPKFRSSASGSIATAFKDKFKSDGSGRIDVLFNGPGDGKARGHVTYSVLPNGQWKYHFARDVEGNTYIDDGFLRGLKDDAIRMGAEARSLELLARSQASTAESLISRTESLGRVQAHLRSDLARATAASPAKFSAAASAVTAAEVATRTARAAAEKSLQYSRGVAEVSARSARIAAETAERSERSAIEVSARASRRAAEATTKAARMAAETAAKAARAAAEAAAKTARAAAEVAAKTARATAEVAARLARAAAELTARATAATAKAVAATAAAIASAATGGN